MKALKYKARLPVNLQPKRRIEQSKLAEEMLATGDLIRVNDIITQRLKAYDTEVDDQGVFYLMNEPKSDNAIWCLLRADVESQLPGVKSHMVRSLVHMAFAHIRKHAPKTLARGERAVIISPRGEL